MHVKVIDGRVELRSKAYVKKLLSDNEAFYHFSQLQVTEHAHLIISLSAGLELQYSFLH